MAVSAMDRVGWRGVTIDRRTKGGKPAPDGKWVPPKDYVVTAEKAAKPVAIKPPAAKDRVAEEIA